MFADILKAIQLLKATHDSARALLDALTKVSAWEKLYQAAIDSEPDAAKQKKMRAYQRAVSLEILGPQASTILQALRNLGFESKALELTTFISDSSNDIKRERARGGDNELNFNQHVADLIQDFEAIYKDKSLAEMVSFHSETSSYALELSSPEYALYVELSMGDNVYDRPEDDVREGNIVGKRSKLKTEIEQRYSPAQTKKSESPREMYHAKMESYLKGSGEKTLSRPSWAKLGEHRVVLSSKNMESHWKTHNELSVAAKLVADDINKAAPKAEAKNLTTTLNAEIDYFTSMNESLSKRSNLNYSADIDKMVRETQSHYMANATYYQMALVMAASVKLTFEAEGRGMEIQGMSIYRLASMANPQDFIDCDNAALKEQMDKFPPKGNKKLSDEQVAKLQELAGSDENHTELTGLRKEFNKHAMVLEDDEEKELLFGTDEMKEYMVSEEKYLLSLIVQSIQRINKGEFTGTELARIENQVVELSRQLLKIRVNRKWPEKQPTETIFAIFNREYQDQNRISVQAIKPLHEYLQNVDEKIKRITSKEEKQNQIAKIQMENKKKEYKEKFLEVANNLGGLATASPSVRESMYLALARSMLMTIDKRLNKLGVEKNFDAKGNAKKLDQIEHLMKAVESLSDMLNLMAVKEAAFSSSAGVNDRTVKGSRLLKKMEQLVALQDNALESDDIEAVEKLQTQIDKIEADVNKTLAQREDFENTHMVATSGIKYYEEKKFTKESLLGDAKGHIEKYDKITNNEMNRFGKMLHKAGKTEKKVDNINTDDLQENILLEVNSPKSHSPPPTSPTEHVLKHSKGDRSGFVKNSSPRSKVEAELTEKVEAQLNRSGSPPLLGQTLKTNK